jgi:hypothetical protein
MKEIELKVKVDISKIILLGDTVENLESISYKDKEGENLEFDSLDGLILSKKYWGNIAGRYRDIPIDGGYGPECSSNEIGSKIEIVSYIGDRSGCNDDGKHTSYASWLVIDLDEDSEQKIRFMRNGGK